MSPSGNNTNTSTSTQAHSMALADVAQRTFADCEKYALFDASGKVLASNFQLDPSELKDLVGLLDDRESAIKQGMRIDQQRYEVHRFHPPLAYGRTMGCTPEASIGAALCKVEAGVTGQPCFGLITYAMPNLSARMVPILQQLCEQHLTAPQ